MHRRWLAPLFGLALFASAPEAKPATQVGPAEEPPATEREWYGAWVLAADAAFVGVITVGALVHHKGHEGVGNGIIGVGGVSLALGAPLVHALHDRPLTGVGSFFLRPGCSLGSVMVVALALGLSRRDPGPYLPYAAIAGFALGTGLDAALLAFRPIGQKGGPKVTVVPWVDGTRVSVSLGGVF